MNHEQTRTEDDSAISSDRVFGGVLAVFFLIVGAAPAWGGGAWRTWALILSGLLAIAAALAPSVLAPLNRVWMAFGNAMRRITTPVILAFIFFVVITPMGLVMRLFGKDPLRLRFDRSAPSYWISRSSPGPTPETFKDQF